MMLDTRDAEVQVRFLVEEATRCGELALAQYFLTNAPGIVKLCRETPYQPAANPAADNPFLYTMR